jgi:hypothetical protein
LSAAAIINSTISRERKPREKTNSRTDQPGLFDAPDEAPKKRSNKPAPRETLPSAKGSETSKGAAESVAEAAPTLRFRILVAVVNAGDEGMTSDEVERLTGIIHQTCSARLGDMERPEKGFLYLQRTERTRRTQRGRPASVYVATERGKLAVTQGIASCEVTRPRRAA